MKQFKALGATAISVFTLFVAFASRSASASLPPPPDPVDIYFSAYGDSLVYRSGWNCDGLPASECDDLRADSSFVSYPPFYRPRHPYYYYLVQFDGVGGSTCLPRTGDVGLLARLQNPGGYTGVLIGINDVNSAGQSVASTVACLKSAWTKIADQLGGIPVAATYPPFARSIWSGVSDAVALQRRAALNAAIVQAVTDFNATRSVHRARLVRFDLLTAYDPTVGVDTFDGVHPNPNGAELMGHLFFQALE